MREENLYYCEKNCEEARQSQKKALKSMAIRNYLELGLSGLRILHLATPMTVKF